MNMLVHDLGFAHRACDRCHGQKLRCRRESNSSTCVRCARAGVRCTPRQMRLRSRAQSNKDPHPPHLQSHQDAETASQNYATQEESTNDVDNGISNDFNYLPITMLDMSSDLNLESDSTAFRADIDPELAARYRPAGAEARAPNLHMTHQSYSQGPPNLRTVVQAAHRHWGDIPSEHSSEELCDFTSPTAMHPSFPSASLGRNISLSPHQPQDEDNMMDLDQRRGNSRSCDVPNPGTDSGYAASQPETPGRASNNIQETHHSNMSSWIRQLSNSNLQLHQHMHSIPMVEPEKDGQRDSSEDFLTCPDGETQLPVDRTFKLSSQYTELLTSICSRLESCRSRNDTQGLARLVLDQSSQLLVLSSYMCLLQSYDKILQHIKAWLEVRLKMGVRGSALNLKEGEGSSYLLTQLPGLAVGTFEFSKTSSVSSLVLMCIVETNIMQMHSLISECMRPASKDVPGSSRSSGAEKCSMSRVAAMGDGLSSVAKVTLQAIEANEDSILQLVHGVSKLALQRVML
ncbi:unnamed protein product [Penicillium egyptiacum]|uniref:Zn(2)-C6 fungal-type domain-containing protein n=1 Tax=Penicillium egyptiacum TaxID=1303716 RepID=A0A9W4P3R4_9EURO|nr:unnamed protein product [Penicillium egyptiacum]